MRPEKNAGFFGVPVGSFFLLSSKKINTQPEPALKR
jgi:hypothetical protein